MWCSVCGGDVVTQDETIVEVEGVRYWTHANPQLCMESRVARGLLEDANRVNGS